MLLYIKVYDCLATVCDKVLMYFHVFLNAIGFYTL